MSVASRKAQADTNRSEDMVSEIKALRKLAENTAKHAPHLVAELHTTQGDDGIVPTGFISYLLMTWCPGVPLGEGEYDYQIMPQTEKKKVFKAFKEALEQVPVFRAKASDISIYILTDLHIGMPNDVEQ